MDPRQKPVLGSHVPKLGVAGNAIRKRDAGEICVVVLDLHRGSGAPIAFASLGIVRSRLDVHDLSCRTHRMRSMGFQVKLVLKLVELPTYAAISGTASHFCSPIWNWTEARGKRSLICRVSSEFRDELSPAQCLEP